MNIILDVLLFDLICLYLSFVYDGNFLSFFSIIQLYKFLNFLWTAVLNTTHLLHLSLSLSLSRIINTTHSVYSLNYFC